MSNVHEPQPSYRHTRGPDVGHGEQLLRQVNALDASGHLGQAQSGRNRFHSRFGPLFTIG